MAGVYISWPFCAQKCTYCNFASGVFPGELEALYLTALRAELAGAGWTWTPETVYLGGGTPGSMEISPLSQILALIPGRPWREATIEAAPGALTAEHASAWRSVGITRVSLGVQSFVERELRRTGRRHDAAGVARDIGVLRGAGIHEINVDLIAGLPGQTPAGWAESLDWIERLSPPHVSVYMLEIDEDSRLGSELLLGGVRYGAASVPDENRVADFYEQAVERLAAMGLRRYEVSNFALPGHESLHNLKYWRLEPYLGFGSDAHSLDQGLRWQNVETAQEYAARWQRGDAMREEASPASPSERLWVGLRLLEGVALSAEETARYREPVARLIGGGLLEYAGSRLRLTARGVLLSNEVFEEFIEECPAS